ncbi:MAG: hypothetical protein ACI9KE_003435 [Polyangiales bacterium]|jgi:hypothetical protein
MSLRTYRELTGEAVEAVEPIVVSFDDLVG